MINMVHSLLHTLKMMYTVALLQLTTPSPLSLSLSLPPSLPPSLTLSLHPFILLSISVSVIGQCLLDTYSGVLEVEWPKSSVMLKTKTFTLPCFWPLANLPPPPPPEYWPLSNLSLGVLVVETWAERLEHGLACKVLAGDHLETTALTMLLVLDDGVHLGVKVTDVILHRPACVLHVVHVCVAENSHAL